MSDDKKNPPQSPSDQKKPEPPERRPPPNVKPDKETQIEIKESGDKQPNPWTKVMND